MKQVNEISRLRSRWFFAAALLLLPAGFAFGQAAELTQTVRGVVLDADSKAPLPGVTVLVLEQVPTLGATTNADGVFVLKKVPVGRVALQLSFVGYQTKTLPNTVVYSGKETFVEVQLSEAATEISEVVISAFETPGEPLNEMALVSARSISTEEINRLTASFNDPALITANFAGVATSGDGGNDIIVRGNSPKYLQWRLEGMPITNPNHFADLNSVLGTTSALNANLLTTSDFYTGAFPAEYGNALSGVYDVRLRNGNAEKFEGIAGLGLLGTELTVEGPFKKGGKSSYLMNYRYSTASILNDAGLLEVEGKPKFQDAAFKFNFPTKTLGTFSLYGLGGHSTLQFEDATREDWNVPGNAEMREDVLADYDKTSYLGNLGLNHTLSIGSGFLRTSLQYSIEGLGDEVFVREDSLSAGIQSFDSEGRRSTWRIASQFHQKINTKNTLQAGLSYHLFQQDFQQLQRSELDADFTESLNFDEQIGNIRGFVNWKYRPTEALTLVAGIQSQRVMYNGKQSLEPRLSARWEASPKSTFSLGYGLHSSMERVHHYFANVTQTDGSITQPNKDLDLLKAHHWVLGYDHHFTKQLTAKVEVYYQHLYNLPVENRMGSHFSTINEGDELEYYELVNEGKGTNYGIELTVQRSFANHYYLLANASVYESTFEGLDGVQRNTRFNGNYLLNLIGGKEFTHLGKNQNKTIGVNGRLLMSGGLRIIPLLRDETGAVAVEPQANQFWDYSRAYQNRLDKLYQFTISANYKVERKNTTHELFLNLENITNNKGRLTEFYDTTTPEKVGYTTQFGLLPNLMYRVYF